jgi:hypothetical protein
MKVFVKFLEIINKSNFQGFMFLFQEVKIEWSGALFSSKFSNKSKKKRSEINRNV